MMRDFNQWLGDLTSELQEKEDDHSWMADAAPDPCDVCGSTEEVCECEREDYRQDLKKQAAERMERSHSHDALAYIITPFAARTLELQLFQQQMEASLEYLREGHNMTATEVMECQRDAGRRLRQVDYELQAYAIRCMQDMQDMLRRTEREGDDS